nr:hypothetical protein [Tanacetum cinerariifolium]
MDQQYPIVAKIPVLDTRKFKQWQFRIQQYLQHEHYALWEVIEFGDSYVVPESYPSTTTTDTTSGEIGTKSRRTVTLTAEDTQRKKNDVKARTTLLLSLPDKHQLRFSKYKTARELWATILKTFGGNEATKKTKKNLLKQQYGNFKAKGSETLEQTFTRLQVIVGQLQFMDVEIEQDDLNQKFLTSLAPEWLMHTIVWRNRSDLDTMSLDDLYNHLKVYESEVQKKSEPNSQNMAFISSTKHSSGNEDGNTAYVSIASTNVPTATASVDTISQDPACTYIASQSSGSQIKFEDINQIDEDDIDIKWNMALLSMRADKSDKINDGLGYSAVPPPPAQLYLSPKKDLSWTGLPECADDTVTDYSRPSPTIEKAAKTMLADAKFPVTFWAEAVNTAGYVQNRVLVNKSHNKTPYELFNGRSPAIGFLKPFGCQVMILNTLENLEKFKEKGDEGYFIRYSMSSKAFRVFNKRTRRVEENLHVEFLENKAIKKGFGPNWLFDIDSLTKSMNYVLVDASIISTNLSGIKDAACQEVKKNVSSLRYTALLNWAHDALLDFSSSKPQDHCSTEVPEGSGNPNPTASTSYPPADQMETLTVETPIPTVSSPVLTAYSTDSQEPSSDARLISKRVANQEETPSLDNILSLTNQFEDILGVTLNLDESNEVEADISYMETAITASPTPTLRIHKDHPKSQIIGHVDTLIQTRNKSKKIFDALQDPSWVEAMQEELLQFKIQNVWTLVDCPKRVRPIRIKWVLKNKKDERGIVIKNKARPVAQGHTQEEGIDYDEVFSPVARIEAIRLFLAYASFMGFTVYQMDVKSAFLYGTMDEETLFIRKQREDFILVQVYVDDIIFGSSNLQLYRGFKALMHEKFQMSAMGELNFFLGLQVLQKEDGIFLSQDKYVGDILKKFGYSEVRLSNTPMDKENPWGKNGTGKDVDLHLYRSMIRSLMYLTASRPDIMFAVCACVRHQVTPKECHLHAVKRIFRYLKGHTKLRLWYPKESPFDLVAFSDSDYSGATQDRKLTSGGCQFLGRRLNSWQCKKQTIVATSTAEAKYVTTASCCGQVLWIQNQPLDYGDCFEKKLINVDHIHTDENVADLLTKPFDAERFQYLVVEHAMRGFVKGKIIIYTSFVSHIVLGWVIGTSKYWGVLRILMISLRLIPLFWSTARIETTNEGTQILAPVDGIHRTVTESSLRRNLKLQDEEGIRSLPDTKLFENLTLMVPFHTRKLFTTLWVNSPSFSGRIVPLFETMLVQQGEGSCTPTEFHHTSSPEAQSPSHTTHTSPSLPPITTTTILTVTPTETTPIRQYTRRARIAQSYALPTVADESASPHRDVSQGEACPTDSGFIADQDRATIAKSSTFPYDSAPRVTSHVAELTAKFQAQEVAINSLKERIKMLEDREGVAATRSGDDASIKRRSMEEGKAATERISDNSEEMATVLTSMDAATILSSGVVDVPTSSGSIPTASTPAEEQVPTGSDVVPTASPVFATATVVIPYSRRRGKEVMMESKTPKKQRVQEQIDRQVARELEEKLEKEDHKKAKKIARDAEIARIHAEKELQIMINGLDRNNETSQQRKPWTKKQKRDYYMAVIKSNLGWKVKDFRGMTFEEVEAKFNSVWKQMEDFIPMGSKEEAERIKRKGINLEQESAKKQKTSKEVPEEAKSPKEVTEEKRLVKETLSNRPPTSEKEMELWVKLNKMYEPNNEDQLWTHTQKFMHAPVEWKLYDSCGVHHVTAKDKEIFMLVEKDYLLRKDLALVMICYKLQVENYSRMASDLILKIHKIASSPSQQGD